MSEIVSIFTDAIRVYNYENISISIFIQKITVGGICSSRDFHYIGLYRQEKIGK